MPADVLFFPNLSAEWPNAGYVTSGYGYAGGWNHSPACFMGFFALDAGIAVVDDVQYLPTVGEMAFFVDKTPAVLASFLLADKCVCGRYRYGEIYVSDSS